MKVARGRSWQPEIGMEHASRGRRSGNKGVGARWRGRFRIFSARHRSRTKVSHAENSGMTMLFFSWGLLRCRACVDHRSSHAAPCHHGSGWHEGGGGLGGCSGVGGGFFHTLGSGQPRMPAAGAAGTRVFCFCGGELGVAGVGRVLTTGLLREHVLAAGAASHACRRRSGSTRGSGFCLGDFFAVGLGAVAGAWVDHGRWIQTRMPPQSDGTRGFWFRGIVSHALERRDEY